MSARNTSPADAVGSAMQPSNEPGTYEDPTPERIVSGTWRPDTANQAAEIRERLLMDPSKSRIKSVALGMLAGYAGATE